MRFLAIIPLMLLVNCTSGTSNCPGWVEPIRPMASDDLLSSPGLAKSALIHNETGVLNGRWE